MNIFVCDQCITSWVSLGEVQLERWAIHRLWKESKELCSPGELNQVCYTDKIMNPRRPAKDNRPFRWTDSTLSSVRIWRQSLQRLAPVGVDEDACENVRYLLCIFLRVPFRYERFWYIATVLWTGRLLKRIYDSVPSHRVDPDLIPYETISVNLSWLKPYMRSLELYRRTVLQSRKATGVMKQYIRRYREVETSAYQWLTVVTVDLSG
jgi:hypothetical protein